MDLIGKRLAHTITEESWHVLTIQGKKSEEIATVMYVSSKFKAGQELTITVKQLRRLIAFKLVRVL